MLHVHTFSIAYNSSALKAMEELKPLQHSQKQPSLVAIQLRFSANFVAAKFLD